MEKKLEKASKRLICLEEMKVRLEKVVEKYLGEITCIDQKIEESEKDIERLVQEQAVRECQNKIRDEINKLKEEKRSAEMCVKNFKKELCVKMKRLEKCRRHLPSSAV